MRQGRATLWMPFDFFVGFAAPCSVQLGGKMLAAKVVRKRDAALAQLGELGAPLGDDLVFVLWRRLIRHDRG